MVWNGVWCIYSDYYQLEETIAFQHYKHIFAESRNFQETLELADFQFLQPLKILNYAAQTPQN